VEARSVRIRVPGDKSLTQRALILASLADGTSRVSGLLHGGDAESTAGALRALGVPLGPLPEDGGEFLVRGGGLRGLCAPAGSLDLGNSGTGARLLMGVLAGTGLTVTLTGDASLRVRPMKRISEPLKAMGAEVRWIDVEDRLPLTLEGCHPLRPIDWQSPVASAQVKSAILLAGVTGSAFALVTEPQRSRDHTERMLEMAGVAVVSHATSGGWRVELRDPPERLQPLDFRVPGDISSAAFPLALAALGGAPSGVEVVGVGLNPTRTAFLDVLARMGADVSRTPVDGAAAAEPVGNVAVRAGTLRAVSVAGDEVPALIDELPLVAVLASRARGETYVRDAGELRHKESDRIATVVENLRAIGAEADELPDGLVVRGSKRPLEGVVRTRGDHRIAMAFGVLAALPDTRIQIDDPGVAGVSFPGFWELVGTLGHGSRASDTP
jgi:3-phosphoshikimate 1-carboxyvinyltransferase